MTTNEFNLLERDLELAFAVDVPALPFRLPAELPTPRPRFGAKLGIIGAAAAAVLGAILFVPGFVDDGPATASAHELIERSIAAASGASLPANYHTVTVARNAAAETVTESWFGGPERYRVEDRTTAGGRTTIQGTVVVGDEMWMYQGEPGSLTVAHGPRLFAVQPRQPGAGPPLQEQLTAWNDTGCFAADLAGTQSIGGRQAHVIKVTATPERCPYPPKPLLASTLWIDTETHLPLKMTYEGTTQEHSSTYEVQVYEVFDSLPDGMFAYTPPSNATLVEYTDAAGLKRALQTPVYLVPQGSSVTIEASVVPLNR